MRRCRPETTPRWVGEGAFVRGWLACVLSRMKLGAGALVLALGCWTRLDHCQATATTCKHHHRRLQVKDASLLRFLVDMRDADLEAKQMRDDLMTMLIAGGWAVN